MRYVLLVIAAASIGGLAFAIEYAQRELEGVPDYVGQDGRLPTTDGFYHASSSLEARRKQAQSGKSGYRFKDGILAFDYGGDTGVQHNPVSIAQFVLSLVPHRNEPSTRSAILAHLDFLLEAAERTEQGHLMLPFRFDFPSAGQTSPWYSAMAQGQGASAVLWGYRLTSDQRYLDAAVGLVLAMGEEENRFARKLDSGVWLKEYPGYELQVLDGSLAAIAGVYDVSRMIPATKPEQRERVNRLLAAALEGLKLNAECFESPLSGHYFDDSGKLPSVSYYRANLARLAYLVGADAELAAVREDLQAKPLPFWRRYVAAIRLAAKNRMRERGEARPCVK